MDCTKMKTNTDMGALDEMEFFFKSYNNSCLYCNIYFKGFIDLNNLKTAVILSMNKVPALKSKLITSSFHLHWELTNVDINKVISLIQTDNIQKGFNNFINESINEFTGPQIKISVLRALNGDTVCFMINHMICDAAGFKQYLYMLSEIYNNVINHKDYTKSFENIKTVNPSKILKTLNFRKKFKLLSSHYKKYDNNIQFPFGETGSSPFIITYTLSPARFKLLKSYARSLNATINDAVMAAFLRTLYKILNLEPNKSISIPCMIDLRRFLKCKNFQSICNLASAITCTIGSDIGKNFDETVLKVKNDMDKKKNSLLALSGLLQFNILIKFIPHKLLKKILDKIFTNPKISITNIGIIDKNRLEFHDLKIENAFMTGAIKYTPYFQLSLSSFDEFLTFAVNIFGSNNDIKIINNFFSILDKELPV